MYRTDGQCSPLRGFVAANNQSSDMTESRKIVLKETAIIAMGVAVGVALMWGVYALIGKFDLSVVFGGIVGALLAVGNFFFLAVAATMAADKAVDQDVEGGKKMMKNSYTLRLVVLAAILFVCGKSGVFDVVALALPLLFTRPILTLVQFFGKKGEVKS